MDHPTYLATLTLVGLGLLGSLVSLTLQISGTDPTSYLAGMWTWIMVLGTLLAELLMYVTWKKYSPSSSYIQQLQRIALFLIIYAVVQNINNGLLYLVALAVTIFAWNGLYAEAGGASLQRYDQALTLLVFARLMVRPLVGLIFLLLEAVGIGSSLELILGNALTAMTVGVMGYYTYLFGQSNI